MREEGLQAKRAAATCDIDAPLPPEVVCVSIGSDTYSNPGDDVLTRAQGLLEQSKVSEAVFQEGARLSGPPSGPPVVETGDVIIV